MAVEVPDEFISVEGLDFGLGYHSRIVPRAGIRFHPYDACNRGTNWNAAELNLHRVSLDYGTTSGEGKILKTNVTSFPGTPNVAEFRFKLGLNRTNLDIFTWYTKGSIKYEVYEDDGSTLIDSFTTGAFSSYKRTDQITGIPEDQWLIIRIYAIDQSGSDLIEIFKIRIMESYTEAGDL